jgi:hypothetical protein
VRPGHFVLPFNVPDNFRPNEIYYDVWNYIGNPPIPVLAQGTQGTGTEVITGDDVLISDLDNQAHWQSEYGQFWIYDDNWVTDEGLFTKKIGFEPLDKRIRKGEVRTIEVAIHPLPRYSYEYNQLAALIPLIKPTISFQTTAHELLPGMANIPCTIGMRQGHSRAPFVVQCLMDTTNLLIGTYRYNIRLALGSEVIVSEPMHLIVE